MSSSTSLPFASICSAVAEDFSERDLRQHDRLQSSSFAVDGEGDYISEHVQCSDPPSYPRMPQIFFVIGGRQLVASRTEIVVPAFNDNS